MFGNIPPFYNSNPAGSPPATNTTTTAFTGGAWTFTKTDEIGVAEEIIRFTISGYTGDYIALRNGTTTTRFDPSLFGVQSGTAIALTLVGQGATDTGSNPLMRFFTRIGTATTVATRPVFRFENNGSALADVSAKGAWAYVVLHTDAAAENLATWRLDEDTSSQFLLENGSSTNAVFQPTIRAVQSSNGPVLRTTAQGTTDTGANPLIYNNARIGTSTSVATRPLWNLANNGSTVASFSATGVLEINGGSAPGLKVGDTTVGIKKLFMASGTINPASVPANSTNTESFTVTGVATDMVITLNTSALPAGLGIVNVFPTGADTIDVTFMNNTGVAIDAGAVSYYLSGLQFI